MKTSFLTLSKNELKDILVSWGEKAFRASQLWDHVYKKRNVTFTNCSNIPKALIEKLEAEYPITLSQVLVKKTSQDRVAKKYLLEFGEETDRIEVVALRAPSRGTVCVSTQVGCDMGCKFCASTIGGMIRNLHYWEIVEQFLLAGHLSNWEMTHIVVMGMGEPLLNFENLHRSLEIFVSPEHFGISHRRITVSTIGVTEGIMHLADSEIKPSLAISLHAPNQLIREKIIPSASRWDFEEIIAAAGEYQGITGRQVTFEYCMLHEVNDLKVHADLLASKIAGKGFSVNLIPYNPVEGISWERSTPERIERFKSRLEKFGVSVTIRREKGTDISAACGQLRRKEGK